MRWSTKVPAHLAALLGLAAAVPAEAQLIEPPCTDLRSVVGATRGEAPIVAPATPPSLGFRTPCQIYFGEGHQNLSCHQYAGFTYDLYDALTARIASCFPQARRIRTTGRGTGTAPRLITHYDLGDVLITVTLNGLMTRRGNDLHLDVARIDDSHGPPERSPARRPDPA